MKSSRTIRYTLLASVIALTTFCYHARAEHNPNETATTLADGYQLAPQVTELIIRYPGTQPTCLPDPEGWDEINSPYSSAPGRMRIVKHIVVDKPNTTLHVTNIFGDTLSSYPICASKLRGQKGGKDDWHTPEGTFSIYGVYNSTNWKYKDTQDKCYGPYFIALWTPPFWGIGIHGTNVPWSVPGRRSHGCMRMHNEDISRVRQMVDKDTKVTVLPDPTDSPAL